ncbi:TauD/TfdA family dioxygenase [Solimonas soli]|uniref:TauD/TfdA family dioxygenase n=1 Tax=Solimonas soli TaxID=413479 RepID=UPI0004B03828|nr:TauD/TfdA family dioxygenase [Solimonas soli]
MTIAAHIDGGLAVHPLAVRFGARIEGVDLSALDDDTLAAVEAALVQYKVLFFAGQRWTAAQQVAFARRLGDLHRHPVFDRHRDADELVVFAYDETRRGANDTWHSDVSFVAEPVKYSILHAEEIPPLGGDTLWLDAEAAYDGLSAFLKDFLGNLTSEHFFFKNPTPDALARLLAEGDADARTAAFGPVVHPLVRTHPVNGRRSLYVSRAFTTRIPELTPIESDHVLRLLFEHLDKPEFHLRWQWQADTVAIWDNRSTQHLAVSDYFPARRRVRRAAVLGERPR